MKVLLSIAWGLVALDAIFVVVMTVTSNSSDQDAAGRGMASGLAVAAGLVLAVMSGILLFSSRNGSIAGVALAAVILAFPLVVAGAPTVEQIFRQIKQKRDADRQGKFVDPGLTAIAQAITENDVQRMRELLARQPDLDDCDAAGDTLLGYAVRQALEKQGSIEPVRELLNAGADPNQYLPMDGARIIFHVFKSNSRLSDDLFKLLLDKQADPNARDGFGVPIIHHSKGQLLKLKLLIDSDANIDAPSEYHSQSGWTPAMTLTMNEAYDEALYLVQRGADVQYTAPDGSSLSSVLKQRRQIASESNADLPESLKALSNTVAVHARRRRINLV